MRLTDEASNTQTLPAFLAVNGGLNSGFMILQYTAAALATENKVLVAPGECGYDSDVGECGRPREYGVYGWAEVAAGGDKCGTHFGD